ncbi:hypothetical protein PsYK624_009540 [Phanerochaete sordida]|uniref:Uncharacterized protein n=1 Tax=Phanerochaete sordida TaxID=48140 RepID=A0A9P3FYF0_9APHY|nr:hypothetical protein PsYK624_009540 [Phanerochaete sordida]
MAGHKRPHGWPICPPRQSPGPGAGKSREATPEFVPRIGGTYHFKNPNYIESSPEQPPQEYRRERSGSPCTWVSTEPADDIPTAGPSTLPNDHLRRQRPAQELEMVNYTTSQASVRTTTSSSTTARIRRTLSSFITSSVPAVTLFSTPRENVQVLTKTARLNGLYTGIMRRPPAKEGNSTEGLGRKHSWWVLMGRDADAVEHLMSLQEQQTMARLEGHPSSSPHPSTALYSPPQYGPSTAFLVLSCFCSFVCGVLLWVIYISVL